MGLVVIGWSGEILEANSAAKDTLHRGGPLTLSHGAIALTSAAHDRRLQSLIRHAQEGDQSVHVMRVPRASGKLLLLLFLPVRANETAGPDKAPLAVLLMNGPLHDPDLDLLMDFFSFTPAEARVAGYLMQGKSVEQVALRLGITESTIRNHLKHMYTKTGTRRQGELVQVLLCSPANLRVSALGA